MYDRGRRKSRMIGHDKDKERRRKNLQYVHIELTWKERSKGSGKKEQRKGK